MDLFGHIEAWFERRNDIRPIGEGGYILRVGVARYRGPETTFQDGTVLRRGDLIGDLHVDNRRAATLHEGGKSWIRWRRELVRALPALARDLRTRQEYQAIQVLGGPFLFWELATHWGFENRPVPARSRWWQTWLARFLLARYHPGGRARLGDGKRKDLRQIWITRRTLLERYGRSPSSPK